MRTDSARGERGFGRGIGGALGWVLALVLPSFVAVRADTVLGPWVPLFKGVDHAVGTNTPGGGGFDRLQVIQAIRVDLTDPDLRLLASPRRDPYQPEFGETSGYTVSDYLVTNRLQVAINVNAFEPGQYYLPAGTAMDVLGLMVCGGTNVSTQTSAEHAAAVLFDAANRGTIIPTNWPARSLDGVHTAVSGEYAVLVGGVNVGERYHSSRESIHRVQPRTAFGLSRDGNTLFLLTIDGRQPGYSEGALDGDTAEWMLRLGAWDAVNMDGGGSTTLVVADGTGAPVRLNSSSAVADSGRERTVGAHFGIYAKPAVGFVNDVVADPDDTTATLTWTTVEPATSQVEYGTTRELGQWSELETSPVTRHSMRLGGLSSDTTYYFSVVSTAGDQTYRSPVGLFRTTNYVTTNLVFDLSHPWRFTGQPQDGVAWQAPGFDDSGWDGPGPGLFWIDVRATGPNPAVQPKNTALPASPANGYPFVTYYFRTRFEVASAAAGSTLRFLCYLDDGAVIYLNGQELHRLNMEEAPAPVTSTTLATGYTFAGDATEAVDFTLPAAGMLRAGENVLAVEVHNYNALSPDATFGTSLILAQPAAPRTSVSVAHADGGVRLSWDRDGFTLQQATGPAGPWVDVPGPVTSSPYSTAVTDGARFFRLRR